MTTDPEQVKETIQKRLASRTPRLEIVFELERMGLSRAEANAQIDAVIRQAEAAAETGQQVSGVDPRQMLRQDYRDAPPKPFFKRPRMLIGMAVTLGVLAFTVYGFFGTSDSERVEAQNEAAASGERSDGTAKEIDLLDVRTGDCFDDRFLENIDGEVRNLSRVPCDASARFVIESLELMPGDEDASYPVTNDFTLFALGACPEVTEWSLYPIEDLWEAGSRVVSCVAPW